MINDFSISDNIQPVSNGSRRLAPWEIHSVKLSSVEKVSMQGKKDPEKTYDMIKVRFDNDDGYYEESIFYPGPDDNERPEYESKDGHKYKAASRWDRTKMFIIQTLFHFNPEGFKKFQMASSKFKDFDTLAKAYIKLMNEAIGKETNLKLVGRVSDNGTVVACLPKFVGINRDGEAFMSQNFVGDKLFYTPYEEGQRNKFKSASPTNMPDLPIDSLPNTPQTDMKVDDLQDLLNDL